MRHLQPQAIATFPCQVPGRSTGTVFGTSYCCFGIVQDVPCQRFHHTLVHGESALPSTMIDAPRTCLREFPVQ